MLFKSKILAAFLIAGVCLLLNSCGTVSKNISDSIVIIEEDPSPDTVMASETAGFLAAVVSYTDIATQQNQDPGELISTASFQLQGSAAGFSTQAIDDDYPYWYYETRTRVINGLTETIQSQHCYYLDGVRLGHFYTGGSFDYIERYLEISSSRYTCRFHEKITYSGLDTLVEVFPGSAYPSEIIFNGITIEIPLRAINYNLSTHNGGGTMQLVWGEMSGTLDVLINGDVFSLQGYLNKEGKRAVLLSVNDDNQTAMTFLVNKTAAAQYYYSELNLLSADLISNTVVEIMDSGSYTTQLILANLSGVTVAPTAGAQPELNAAAASIMQVNNCSGINIKNLVFENQVNRLNYYYLRADNSTDLHIEGCTFSKSNNAASTFLYLQGITSASVSGCDFTYSLHNQKNIGIQLYTAGIDNNIIFSDNTYSGLQYGILLTVGSSGDLPLTVSDSLFQDNKYGIYRSNTDYLFNNINNTFINSSIR